jgi:hypothetical protein
MPNVTPSNSQQKAISHVACHSEIIAAPILQTMPMQVGHMNLNIAKALIDCPITGSGTR